MSPKIKKIIKNSSIYFLVDYIRKLRFFKHRYHHSYNKYLYKKSVTSGAKTLNEGQIDRLVTSVADEIRETPTSKWSGIFELYQSDIIPLIDDSNFSEIGKELINPTTNNLMYGFDNLAKILQNKFRLETIYECETTADHFVALAEYVGVTKMACPEGVVSPFKRKVKIDSVVDEIISSVFKDELFSFPNPFNGEVGIKTKFGVASIRVPAAIYQSIRVTEIGSNICEIGAGLGRTAYFSTLLGATKYTLVDIPVSLLIQGHFLLQSLGDQKFVFNGEEAQDAGIHLMTPSHFLKSNEKYDLVLNVDSLTEIGVEATRGYLSVIAKRAKYFFSINHENNEFSISDVVQEFEGFQLISRNRSWVRRGYVEELYKIN